MKKEKQNTIRFITVFASGLFPFFILGISVASAATFHFDVDSSAVGVGQTFAVAVTVDSEGEEINAVGGTITIPDFMEVNEIRSNKSAVGFWADKPHVDGKEVRFEGAILGGMSGTAELFTLIVTTEGEGQGAPKVSDVEVLLNDGEGTKTSFTPTVLALQSDKKIPIVSFDASMEDTVPPEAFTPEVASNPSLFDGDYFVAFSAKDTDSGISRYEIIESKKHIKDLSVIDTWEIAESPYRLTDQSRKSYIYIRAIDRSGNIRIATIEPEVTYWPNIITFTLATVLVLVIALVRFMYRRKIRK